MELQAVSPVRTGGCLKTCLGSGLGLDVCLPEDWLDYQNASFCVSSLVLRSLLLKMSGVKMFIKRTEGPDWSCLVL